MDSSTSRQVHPSSSPQRGYTVRQQTAKPQLKLRRCLTIIGKRKACWLRRQAVMVATTGRFKTLLFQTKRNFFLARLDLGLTFIGVQVDTILSAPSRPRRPAGRSAIRGLRRARRPQLQRPGAITRRSSPVLLQPRRTLDDLQVAGSADLADAARG